MVDDQKSKYKDILKLWWDGYKNTLKETTCYKKQEEMRVHILPILGDMCVEDITIKNIQDFINLKLYSGSQLRHPNGLSPSTIIGFCKIINSSLNWAVSNNYIKENPYKGVVLPKNEYKEIQVFKQEEIDKLINVAKPKWFGDMILLSYRTGMRRGEIFGLKWDDINIKNKFLMVRRTIVAYAPNIKLIHNPKTKKSIRRIMLDDRSIEMLEKRKQFAKSKWVFENQYGELMSPWYTTKYMCDACKKAEIPHRSFHILRHTHATFLLSEGIHPKIVQERLGHSKISMTLDTYSHVIPTMQEVAINVLNEK